VKLLFDENLSPLLVIRLADLYPGSSHVHDEGFGHSDDQEIWAYARAQGFAIASKDSDFAERSILAELAPKILWIRLGNCSTNAVEMLLRARHDEVRRFGEDGTERCLALGTPIQRKGTKS